MRLRRGVPSAADPLAVLCPMAVGVSAESISAWCANRDTTVAQMGLVEKWIPPVFSWFR